MDRMKGLFWGMLACVVLTLLFGCTTTRYVPVPSVSVDSVYVDRWLRDSVYLKDSVFVNQWTQGDTVYRDKVVTKYQYKDRWRYDTVAIVRADSVRVPYPVERRLSTWEQVRLNVGGWVIALVVITILVVVGWAIYKIRK
mgnify:CR=1 FL=1